MLCDTLAELGAPWHQVKPCGSGVEPQRLDAVRVDSVHERPWPGACSCYRIKVGKNTSDVFLRHNVPVQDKTSKAALEESGTLGGAAPLAVLGVATEHRPTVASSLNIQTSSATFPLSSTP